MEDIRVLAFFYIEQAALMSYVGMGVIGVRVSMKHVLYLGLLQGIVVYLLRSICYVCLRLPFGVHMLLSFISLFILFHLVLKKDLAICLAATIISFIMVLLGEGTVGLAAFQFPQAISFDQLSRNIWDHIKLGHLAHWPLLLTTVYLVCFKKPLINIEARQQKV